MELSKLFMYYNYYDNIAPLLRNPRIMFSDTDSLLINSDEKSSETVFKKLHPFMDFSNYPQDHVQHTLVNKNRLGYFKDELKGTHYIKTFWGVRSKTYCLYSKPKKAYSKYVIYKTICKGITKSGKAKLNYLDFNNAIFNITTVETDFNKLNSKKHVLSIINQKKIAFSSFDCKRHLYDCKVHTVPFGYYKLQYNNICIYCKNES